MLLETINVNGLTGKIYTDKDAESPRDFDNLATMICFHRRYRLGDKHDYRADDFTSWNDFEAALHRADPRGLIVPLFLYDHSGITISTRPFSCPWDSGQIGFAVVSSKRIMVEFGVKRITQRTRSSVLAVIEGEVETYDAYIRGDVYGFVVEDGGRQRDSCWGFYGLDVVREEMLSAMNAAA